ncbi:MAG: hypothetical protein IJW03_03475 [Clostridia bacterium]|nr:hypothetical protein [Clostridia bacterium]
MTMTKLYTTFFDEELKSRGFKRKAKLYYRLNGDMLQGVVLKAINPYSIHFYSAPYWMENIQAELSPLYKGYWAEHGIEISPDTFSYYRAEKEEMNVEYMHTCFTLAKRHILPILDRMYDLNSYIENLTPNWPDIYDEKAEERVLKIYPRDLNRKFTLKEHEIEKLRLLNTSPEEVDQNELHMDYRSTVTMLYHLFEYQSYSAFLQYGCDKGDLQAGLDLLKEIKLPAVCSRDLAQERYMKFMTDDGLEKAKAFLDTKRVTMRIRLRAELGLDIF